MPWTLFAVVIAPQLALCNSIPNSSPRSPSRHGLVVSIFAYQSKGRGIEPRLERLWFFRSCSEFQDLYFPILSRWEQMGIEPRIIRLQSGQRNHSATPCCFQDIATESLILGKFAVFRFFK